MEKVCSFTDAQKLVLQDVSALGAEACCVENACGRYLAQPIYSKVDLPRTTQSAVDGFAVRACDTGLPLSLRHPIATGERLPDGTDSVVMKEHVQLGQPITLGSHVRTQGCDVADGELVFAPHTRVTPSVTNALLQMEYTSVDIFRAPKIAFMASGDELANGQIIDSNTGSLMAAAKQSGAQCRSLGIARDTLDAHVELLRTASDADVVITTGGSSVGDRDFILEAFKTIGVEILFWKVAMRPGKPIMFGRRGQQLFFGLPGNPVSCLVGYYAFVAPVLRRLMGEIGQKEALRARVIKGEIAGKAAGSTLLVRAQVEVQYGELVAEIFPEQHSGHIVKMACTNALCIVPEDISHVSVGARLETVRLDR